MRGLTVPKQGFRSITVSDSIYDSFQAVYDKNKAGLQRFGINSFTGFLTYILNDAFSNAEIWNEIMTHIARSQTDALDGLLMKK